MTRFRLHQDVAVVEHDDATRKPREGGKVYPARVVRAAADSPFVQVQADDLYGALSFRHDSGWPAWTARHTCRLVPVCHRTECENPVLDPCTEDGDPLGREWCSPECHDDSGQAWMEQHYQNGVAT